jgi:hypothetical protein
VILFDSLQFLNWPCFLMQFLNMSMFNDLSLLVVKTFRKKFAKELAKLDPANNNNIDFKLDDNEDSGAFEGQLKDLVPHGLGRHVKRDGSCVGCWLEDARLS